jgi:uncharacterized protein (DUF58 family)
MKKRLKLDLSQNIKRLKILTNQIVNTRFAGGYESVFKGRGLEFGDYRPYTPNDDAAMIDWKASVRSKQVLVREFVEERNLNVFFLIDVSSSMVYGSGDKLKMEYVGELVAALSSVILSVGDSVGFAMFTDKIVKSALPAGGFAQYHNIIRTLVDPNYYGGKYDLNEALKFTLTSLKEASIVIIVSDFIGLKNDWKKYLKMLSKKFDLIGIMVRDPRDMALPDYNAQVILEDPFSNKQIIVRPESISQAYRSYVLQQEKMISSVFLSANADFIKLRTDKPFVEPITSFFIERASRMR